MKRIIASVIIIFIINNLNAQYSQNCTLVIPQFYFSNPFNFSESSYVNIFDENFNGNSINTNIWNIWEGVKMDFGFSLAKQWYTVNNIEVSNGTLKLISKRETVTETYWDDEAKTNKTSTFDFTSAAIKTFNKYSYGKYEIRCKFPDGQGFFPSFWLWCDNRWNELDIFDNLDGNEKFECSPSYDYDGCGIAEGCHWSKLTPNFSGWHTYTCFWEPDRIIWEIDHKEVRTFYRLYTENNVPVLCGDNIAKNTYLLKPTFPIQDMQIIVTLQIRSEVKAPNENTIFPTSMEIDYIRYFKKINCCSNVTILRTSDLNLSDDCKVLNFICGHDIFFNGNITIGNNKNLSVSANNSFIMYPGFSISTGSTIIIKAGESLCDQ